MSALSEAICKEAALRPNYINEPIGTIYFGGGTPSLLDTVDLHAQLETFDRLFSIERDAEITLESNPDDITSEKLIAWKSVGINRLSIGVQSFYDADLLWMNRAHSSMQAVKSIELALDAGFNNITIDLIYGTPTLTDEQWQQNVMQAINMGVPHLSCYALTVEPKTALEKMIETKKISAVDPEKQGRQFELLMEWAGAAGYEHYEISNFARPGFRSRHNSSYWQGKPYLGLGPSAHSFNGNSRQWNVANNALYMQNIEQHIIPAEVEILTGTQKLNEYIMTALRTTEGINMEAVTAQWGSNKTGIIQKSVQKFIQQQLVLTDQDQIKLTQKGKLFADGIAADLFF